MPDIHIKTPRLFMRDLMESDAEFIFELDSDPAVQRYVGNSPLTTVDQAREVIKNIRQQYVENGIGRWAVFESATGAFIGWAGLKLITEPINGYVNHYDLGYRFMKKYWRKGYASEVAKALVEYGFDILKQNEIHAYTHAGNTASQRVLLKSGFKFIEQFEDDDDDCDWFTITRNSSGNKNQG